MKKIIGKSLKYSFLNFVFNSHQIRNKYDLWLKEENMYIVQIINVGLILIYLTLLFLCFILDLIYEIYSMNSNIIIPLLIQLISHLLDLIIVMKMKSFIQYEAILPIFSSFNNILFSIIYAMSTSGTPM